MITGAHGFLGANAQNFLSAQADIIGVSRDQHDLTTPESLAAEINRVKPDYLLHTAAIASHHVCDSNPDLAFAVNARATQVIAQACEQAGTKLIFISTDAVFSGQPTPTQPAGDYKELDPPSPNTVYGDTKLQGEIYAQNETRPLIIRTNFFGWSPSRDRSILEFFINSLRQNKPVSGFTNVTTTSLYVQTLLDYIYQLKDHAGVFHVTSSDALTKYQFGVFVAEQFGLDGRLITPEEVPEAKNISLNTHKLAVTLGIEVQSQVRGIGLSADQEGCLT
jgi:dTDP-4-dehydrorhamnose reductase